MWPVCVLSAVIPPDNGGWLPAATCRKEGRKEAKKENSTNVIYVCFPGLQLEAEDVIIGIRTHVVHQLIP